MSCISTDFDWNDVTVKAELDSGEEEQNFDNDSFINKYLGGEDDGGNGSELEEPPVLQERKRGGRAVKLKGKTGRKKKRANRDAEDFYSDEEKEEDDDWQPGGGKKRGTPKKKKNGARGGSGRKLTEMELLEGMVKTEVQDSEDGNEEETSKPKRKRKPMTPEQRERDLARRREKREMLKQVKCEVTSDSDGGSKKSSQSKRIRKPMTAEQRTRDLARRKAKRQQLKQIKSQATSDSENGTTSATEKSNEMYTNPEEKRAQQLAQRQARRSALASQDSSTRSKDAERKRLQRQKMTPEQIAEYRLKERIRGKMRREQQKAAQACNPLPPKVRSKRTPEQLEKQRLRDCENRRRKRQLLYAGLLPEPEASKIRAQIEKDRQRTRERRAQMTPEQKAHHRQVTTLNRLMRLATMSQEELDQRKHQKFMARQASLAKLSREERQALEKKHQERIQARKEKLEQLKKDPEKYRIWQEKQNASARKCYQKKREKMGVASKKGPSPRYKNMTEEQIERVRAQYRGSNARRKKRIEELKAKGLTLKEIRGKRAERAKRKSILEVQPERLIMQTRVKHQRFALRKQLRAQGVGEEEINRRVGELTERLYSKPEFIKYKPQRGMWGRKEGQKEIERMMEGNRDGGEGVVIKRRPGRPKKFVEVTEKEEDEEELERKPEVGMLQQGQVAEQGNLPGSSGSGYFYEAQAQAPPFSSSDYGDGGSSYLDEGDDHLHQSFEEDSYQISAIPVAVPVPQVVVVPPTVPYTYPDQPLLPPQQQDYIHYQNPFNYPPLHTFQPPLVPPPIITEALVPKKPKKPKKRYPPPPIPLDQRKRFRRCEVICDICGQGYSRKDLKTHKNQMHNPNYCLATRTCKICGEVWKPAQKWYSHYVNTHKNPAPAPEKLEKKVVCELCGKLQSSRENLRLHKYYSHGDGAKKENFVRCHLCPKERLFKKKHTYYDHLRRFHPDYERKAYECIKCSESFHQEEELKEHCKANHKEIYFECGYCGNYRWSQLALNFHYVRICRKISKEQKKEEEQKWKKKGRGAYTAAATKVRCGMCGNVNCASSLTRHFVEVHGAKGEDCFECGICGKSFKQRTFWVVHLEEWHGKKVGDMEEEVGKLNLKNREGLRERGVGRGGAYGKEGVGGKGKGRKGRKRDEEEEEEEGTSSESEEETSSGESGEEEVMVKVMVRRRRERRNVQVVCEEDGEDFKRE